MQLICVTCNPWRGLAWSSAGTRGKVASVRRPADDGCTCNTELTQSEYMHLPSARRVKYIQLSAFTTVHRVKHIEISAQRDSMHLSPISIASHSFAARFDQPCFAPFRAYAPCFASCAHLRARARLCAASRGVALRVASRGLRAGVQHGFARGFVCFARAASRGFARASRAPLGTFRAVSRTSRWLRARTCTRAASRASCVQNVRLLCSLLRRYIWVGRTYRTYQPAYKLLVSAL